MSVPNTYSNVHRRFLQIMMNRRMVSHEDALKAFIGCYNTYSTTNSTGLTDKEYQNLMESAIKMINQVIKQFNMAIRSAEDEITCHQFYLFINTADNPITKKFNKYSSSELEFFKQVLSEIVSAEDGRVPSTVCLNLSLGPAKQMSKSSMEDLIDKLCNDLWLVQKNGQISLSLLSIVELDPVLQTYEQYISKCPLCKRIVIRGFRCDNCAALTHMYCLKRFARGQSTPACSQCGEDQPQITEALNNLYLSASSSSAGGGGDDDDDDEPVAGNSQRGSKYKKGRR